MQPDQPELECSRQIPADQGLAGYKVYRDGTYKEQYDLDDLFRLQLCGKYAVLLHS